MQHRLVLASTNPGKLAELKALLQGLRFEVVSLASLGVELDVEETGETFAENAHIKALAAAEATGALAVADDSGLEVEALDGQPGVRSSRIAPGDPERIAWILERLEGQPDRRRGARFVCALALARPGQVLGTWEGAAEGVIADHPHGEHGFGYDPIFYYPPLGKTFAELEPDAKNAVSHRSRALRAFAADLPRLTADLDDATL